MSAASSLPDRRPRAVYVTDTMADIRMIEGLGERFDLTVLAPAVLGDRVTNYWPPRPSATVTKVQLPGGRIGFVPRAAWWLRRHRDEFDVVYALDNLVAALAANVGHRLGGAPVILQIGRPTMEYLHCQAAHGRGGRGPAAAKHAIRVAVANALVAKNERMAAGIGAVSEYCAAQCARHNDNVRPIFWYGVDTATFSPHTPKADARRRLDLPLDEPIVMLRSRLAPEKDPETFLCAIGRLRAAGRRLTALYMGGELDEMAELVARTGVDVVARKPASVDEIPLWYMAADIDVQTSHAEGLGVSPLEALACGTPIIVTDTGGLVEVVDHGRVGLLVPPGDDLALADAIATYLDDPDLAARHAAAGQVWVEERFGSAAQFDAWAQIGLDAITRTVAETSPARRVLFVDHEARLSGGERDLVDLIRAFDPADVDAHVAVPEDGALAAALRSHGATVHIVPMGGALRATSRWELARNPLTALRHLVAFAAVGLRLARLAADLRPDVVHSNSMKAHLLAAPAAWRIGRPLIWHVRDILEAGWLLRAFLFVARVVPAHVIVLSQAAAEPWRAGGLGHKTTVVYNGIRLAPVADGDVAAWRERLGAGPDEAIAGIVGQIAHWKGQDVLIEAAGLLAASRPDLRFAIVGECLFRQNEGEYEAGLHRRVKELDLEDRVHFAGYADPIEPVMTALDVFVHASRLPEPFGRVIIEAMASGTPAIASTRGAGPELVPEAAGCLVEPGDPTALAAAIDGLTRDPEMRAVRAEAARIAAARFGIEATASGVLCVYDAVLHAGRHRP